MIVHVQGNLLNVRAELLVNASNGKGWMGGLLGRFVPLKGVAESIHFSDPSIERAAKKAAKIVQPKCGEVFFTPAGKLNFPKGIIHAVTMERPGQKSELVTIRKCIKNILLYCEENNIKTVSLPLLGTGTGRLDKEEVLSIFSELLKDSNSVFYVVHYK